MVSPLAPPGAELGTRVPGTQAAPWPCSLNPPMKPLDWNLLLCFTGPQGGCCGYRCPSRTQSGSFSLFLQATDSVLGFSWADSCHCLCLWGYHCFFHVQWPQQPRAPTAAREICQSTTTSSSAALMLAI